MKMAFVGLTVALAGCAAPPPIQPNAPIAELAGRVAGQPQRCVSIRQGESLQPANRNTLLYGHGRTVWINELQGGCGGFSRWDVLVLEPVGTQYCRGDLVRSIDPVSRIPGPTCRLGDFMPYTRG